MLYMTFWRCNEYIEYIPLKIQRGYVVCISLKHATSMVSSRQLQKSRFRGYFMPTERSDFF